MLGVGVLGGGVVGGRGIRVSMCLCCVVQTGVDRQVCFSLGTSGTLV